MYWVVLTVYVCMVCVDCVCDYMGSNRPTPAVADKNMKCVNFTWLGTNIF